MVATRAGVSQATVSHILNGKGAAYHVDTREKVIRAAKELRYRPNRYARAVRNGKTGLIALVGFGGRNQITQRKMQVALESLTQEGFEPLLKEDSRWAHGLTDQGAALCQDILDARVEGALLVHPQGMTFSQENVIKLLAAGVPTVAIGGHYLECIPRFSTERVLGYHDLAEHLIKLGYKDLAVIADNALYPYAGVERAVAKHAGAIGLRHYLPADVGYLEPMRSFVRGKAGMEKVLSWKRRPDAVLCANDQWTQGALTACAEAGLSVPHDIALTGFDDDISSAFGVVPITTVAQPIEEIAKGAVQCLLEMIRRQKNLVAPKEVRFPGTMIVRRSCGAYLKQRKAK